MQKHFNQLAKDAVKRLKINRGNLVIDIGGNDGILLRGFEEIDDCVEEMNSKPRKCLGYFTPNEVFLGKLNNQGVAIQPRM